jgi:type I restriction-modification system DNA methylase subunit
MLRSGPLRDPVISGLSLATLERHPYAAADILLREGMDAATDKDVIFNLLFLNRCSDVFKAEREKPIGRKVKQGTARERADVPYGTIEYHVGVSADRASP